VDCCDHALLLPAELKRIPEPSAAVVRGLMQRKISWRERLVLVPVTVVPIILQDANPAFTAGTLLLSLVLLYFGARLATVQSSESARRLLLASIIYLPLVFAVHVLARI